jgi:quercetin dioxygenase-like cupin family protein
MVQQTIEQTSPAASDSTRGANSVSPCEFVRAGTGPVYRSPVDQIQFLITGEQTGGAVFMAQVSVPPGCGNPPHIHRREQETFYLQQGTLTVQVGGETLTALPGDLVCLPRDVPHSFQNNGDVDAKFLLVAAPAGLEKFFEEAFYPVADCPNSPPMTEAFLARVLAAASKCGLEFLPPA